MRKLYMKVIVPARRNAAKNRSYKHIKGPLVAAFGSPLMEAPDRSVKMLGLWIVISQLHSLNL